MVVQALINRRWVADIKGALIVQVIVEYIFKYGIWLTTLSYTMMCQISTMMDMVDNLFLDHDVPDQHKWRLIQSGSYTSISRPTMLTFWDPSSLRPGKDLEILGSAAL